MRAEGGRAEGRTEVVFLRAPEGALSVELMPLRDGTHRGFISRSPRGLKLSEASAASLGKSLEASCPGGLLAADTKKRLLARALGTQGWKVSRAVEAALDHKCSMCTTYDIPLDDSLQDDRGEKPDISNTSHMVGVSMDLGDRPAFGFYTDDGDTARVVSEGARKQGMLVAHSSEDMMDATECLVRFLAVAKKKWAVFSVDMGRFIRRYEPRTMWRMSIDAPIAYDHSVKPVSRDTKKLLLRMFCDYYDEGMLHSSMRLRNMLTDKSFSVFVTDGGFVITRLEGEAGLIYDIYVTPARQGEGMGGELMRCAMSSLAGRAATAYLHTSYPRAKSLYERFGFKTTYSQLAVRLDEMMFSPP